MANLADVIVSDASDSDFPGNSETARKALTEAVTTQTDDTPDNRDTKQQDNLDEVLPAKFKGKSVKDIVEAYQNLESRYGSMANDLGVQRQLTDRLLGLKREDDLKQNGGGTQKQKPAPVTTNDLLDRPQETLERVVNDGVQSVRQDTKDTNARLQNLEAQLARSQFENKHRDYKQTVQDPAFIDWIKASPLRMRAAAVANNGDWVVADELFTEYEGTKTATKQQSATRERKQEQPTDDNLESARQAGFTTGGNASGTDGQAKPGKIYKRSDLIALRINDPDAYYDEAFQAEILKAHAEKRIK